MLTTLITLGLALASPDLPAPISGAIDKRLPIPHSVCMPIRRAQLASYQVNEKSKFDISVKRNSVTVTFKYTY